MSDYLKSLSVDQIKHLIKKRFDEYLGREFNYTIKNLNTPNVNTEGNRINFEVQIEEPEKDIG